jgi:hypothetical protein
MLTNFSDEELILFKATVLGVAEEISESLVDRINTKNKTNVSEPSKTPPEGGKLRLCTTNCYQANWTT